MAILHPQHTTPHHNTPQHTHSYYTPPHTHTTPHPHHTTSSRERTTHTIIQPYPLILTPPLILTLTPHITHNPLPLTPSTTHNPPSPPLPQAWRFVRNGVSLFLLLSFVGAIMDEKGRRLPLCLPLCLPSVSVPSFCTHANYITADTIPYPHLAITQ